MNFTNNKYITTILSLLLIFFLGCVKNNININVYNNIIFKILYLTLIFIIIDKDYSLGLFFAIIFIILDHITTYNNLTNILNELEHSKQLEHFTQDFIIENNII
jgi:hypothetical protein